MQMIINDLSAKFPVDTISEGRQIMDSFFEYIFESEENNYK